MEKGLSRGAAPLQPGLGASADGRVRLGLDQALSLGVMLDQAGVGGLNSS